MSYNPYNGKAKKTTAPCSLHFFDKDGDRPGGHVPSVRVECDLTGEHAESYGRSDRSINRACVLLNKGCSCGADYHNISDE